MTTTAAPTITGRQVTALLVALGPTRDAVATALLRGGYFGDVCVACTCPLATYLTASDLDLADLAVGPTTVAVVPAGQDPGEPDAWQQIPLPAAVAAFINAFDSGAYPHLIRDQHTGDPHA